MKRLGFACALLAACSSDKYVHVETSNGRSFYAKRTEVEHVDAQGKIDVENVLTGKRVTLKRMDCVVRDASRAEVTRARGNYVVYEK